MKRKNESNSRKLLKQIAIALSIIVAVVFACIGILLFLMTNPSIRCIGTLFPSEQNLEEFARIEIPESSSNMRYTVRESSEQLLAKDCTLWLRFEMDADEFEEYEISRRITTFEDTFPGNSQLTDYMNLENWSQPDNLLFGQFHLWQRGIETLQWILIDTGNDSKWTVYIITNEDTPDY